MSSTVKRILLASPLIISAAALAASLAPTLPDGQSAAPRAVSPAPVNDLSPALLEWNRLRQSDMISFQDAANFLMAHPGWPGETRLKRLAEAKADPAIEPAALVVSFFTRFPPTSASGKARYADALMITGREAEARVAAKAAWIGGVLAPDVEARLLGRFGGALTQLDQDQRMEKLLSDRATGAAALQLSRVSPPRRPIYEARLALLTKRADADTLASALGSGAMRDPGFVVDRARWLKDNLRWIEARQLLSQPLALDGVPVDPQKWLGVLLEFASAAQKDGQGSIAYGIAANADKAFAAGTDIRTQSFGVRDVYTSLVWAGGQAAFRNSGRPVDAIGMFDRYARAAQTPQTQTKGWYWAGRAALAANDRIRADSYFAAAAQHGDQFYGQLAAERVGRPAGIIPEATSAIVPEAARSSFEASELVRAARLLGQQGRWADQSLFLRAIAQTVETDTDHALAGELARAIGRPDLGVMVARNWRNSGKADPIRIGFPSLAVPGYSQRQWTMIHAIARQESQFDRNIVSPAGARGLMQLMPRTAEEQAGKLGMAYDFDRLTSDPQYNIMLGSAFFARMLDYYGGSHVLAIAAYNAGPGNVNKWLAANGDPRMPGVDVLEWIEAIPLSETRGYVQRVLENAVVYDRLNPAGALTPAQNRLSAYLGKSNPG